MYISSGFYFPFQIAGHAPAPPLSKILRTPLNVNQVGGKGFKFFRIGSSSSRPVHRSSAFSGAIMRPMATHRCLNKNCFKKYWRICLKIAKQSHRFTLHLNRLRSIKVAFPAKTDSTVFSQFLRSWAVRKPKEPALKAITGGILL